jgi:hypothetical protein
MRSPIASWLALPSGDRWRLLGLMLGLPMVAGLLRIFGLVRTRRWLENLSRNKSPRDLSAGDLDAAQRLTRLADIAGRRGAIHATCLRQALLIHFLLRRRGLAPEFKLGVRKQDGSFDAHAWVELQGVALGQADLTHVPFSELGWTSSAIR